MKKKQVVIGTQNPFASIEVLARLTGTQIGCREICDRWLLITYDLPHNEKGDRARRKFLDTAKIIGATHHTDSVYLMPWTPAAESLALELAKSGEVFLWTSTTTDPARAAEITKSYDEGLKPIMDEISERLDRISEHIQEKHFKRAKKMLDKTDNMLIGLKNAVVRRGSAQLFILVTILERRLNGLYV